MDYEPNGPEQEDVEDTPEIIEYPEPEPELGEPTYPDGTWIID